MLSKLFAVQLWHRQSLKSFTILWQKGRKVGNKIAAKVFEPDTKTVQSQKKVRQYFAKNFFHLNYDMPPHVA